MTLSVHAQVSEYRTKFWIKAYIPERHPTKSDLIFKATNGSSILKAPPAFGFGVAGKCFSTDDRVQSPSLSASARIHHEFTVVTRGRRLSIENKKKKVGVTHLVECDTGKILKSASAPKKDMQISTSKTSSRLHTINIKASSGNPFFVIGGKNVAPKIDWNVSITYDIFDRSFKVNYSHGCFPAFEMYAKNEYSEAVIVVFQNDIKKDCTPINLTDLNSLVNTLSGEWGPHAVQNIGLTEDNTLPAVWQKRLSIHKW